MAKIENSKRAFGIWNFRISSLFRISDFGFRISPRAYARGFTLLETVVALGVIVTALSGPVSLVVRGITSITAGKNKLVALNLAQEGIELARAVRENNIICDSLNGGTVWYWNHDPGQARTTTLSNTAREVDIATTASDICGSQTIITPLLASYAPPGRLLLFDSSNGLYTYAAGQPTSFRRYVEIRTPPDSPDTDIDPSHQMDIIAYVTWSERGGGMRTITLRERIYQWR